MIGSIQEVRATARVILNGTAPEQSGYVMITSIRRALILAGAPSDLALAERLLQLSAGMDPTPEEIAGAAAGV